MVLVLLTGNERRAFCAFWDVDKANDDNGEWSGEGCELVTTNATYTQCCCYHLTSFAVMMEPLEEEVVDHTSDRVAYLTYACIALSMVSLFIFCLIILFNK